MLQTHTWKEEDEGIEVNGRLCMPEKDVLVGPPKPTSYSKGTSRVTMRVTWEVRVSVTYVVN